MNTGDILLFYRSRDQVMTSICTVDRVFQHVTSYEETIRLVGKRTVYLEHELREILSHGSAKIIIFLLHFDLRRYLTLRDLQKNGVIRWAPRSVTEITDDEYFQVIREGRLNERFAVH